MLTALLVATLLQAAPTMFPYIPTHNAPENITNVSTWPSWEKGKAGDSGFIKAEGDHFVDGNGVEHRFLGTNICFTGCFPTHEDADRVAAELARYGINLVRLHYVHHKNPPGRIYPKQDSFIEPVQLERFDYLFAKLKEHGIYTYFQLNIARKFTEQNGIVNAKQLPYFYHGIDNIDFRFIQLQKNFISEIMAHVNPYTGLAYKAEPAISMLELANENALTYAWFTPRYRFPNLVEPYMSEFKKSWNEWLTDHYSSTKALKESWSKGFDGDGTEYIPDGILKENYPEDKWFVQLDGKAQAHVTLERATPKDKLKGTHYLHLTVEKRGNTPNMPQFGRGLFSVKSMQPFTLKLKMRADKATTVDIRLSQAHTPWQIAGLTVTGVQLTRSWQEYSFQFVANMDDEGVRLIICNFTPGTTYDFADVSMICGGGFSWPKDWKLEEENIPIPTRAQWTMPPQRAIDFTEFLYEQEARYFNQMYAHAKANAQVKQPVAGTQLAWALPQTLSRQDYIDCHSYFNHPIFPETLKDYNNWHMGANSLVNEVDNGNNKLSSVARHRILGKPLTISEYDHPNLSYWAAEGNVMGSAMGAFQNWSGIIQFAWSHSDNFFRDVLDSRFDMCSAPQKLAHLPACYAMFVRGDVQTASADTVMARLANITDDIRGVAITQNSSGGGRIPPGLMMAVPMMFRTGTVITENKDLYPLEGHTIIAGEKDVPQYVKNAYAAKEMTTPTGEITWNWQIRNAGFFKVDTDYTKAFTGFVHGRSFDYKGLTLTPGETLKDWLTLTLTCKTPGALRPDGKLGKGSWLLAVTGQCVNTDEHIVEMSNGKYVSAATNDGGSVGVAPILCEGVPAQLRLKGLAGRVFCFALDVDGLRKAQVPVTADGADAILETGPDYQTFWYEIVVR